MPETTQTDNNNTIPPVTGIESKEFYKIGNLSFTSKEQAVLQYVRAADVLIIGPFLIYVSTLKILPKDIRIALFIIGVGTIIYNAMNYLKTVK